MVDTGCWQWHWDSRAAHSVLSWSCALLSLTVCVLTCPAWVGSRAPSRPSSHVDGPRHVALLAWRAAPLTAPLWRARLAPSLHRITTPGAHARRRTASAGADRPRPAPRRRRSSPHLRRTSRRRGWSEQRASAPVWVSMRAVAWHGYWFESWRSHQFVRRGPRGGSSSTRSDADRAAAARQPGRQHRARSVTRAQVMQAAPTATSALRHRGSSTTRRRASIDVPEVPLMMVID